MVNKKNKNKRDYLTRREKGLREGGVEIQFHPGIHILKQMALCKPSHYSSLKWLHFPLSGKQTRLLEKCKLDLVR